MLFSATLSIPSTIPFHFFAPTLTWLSVLVSLGFSHCKIFPSKYIDESFTILTEILVFPSTHCTARLLAIPRNVPVHTPLVSLKFTLLGEISFKEEKLHRFASLVFMLQILQNNSVKHFPTQ